MANKRHLSREECQRAAAKIAKEIDSNVSHAAMEPRIYGVPRGGIPVAYMVVEELLAVSRYARVVYNPDHADYIVDDLIDSGKTMRRYKADYPTKNFYALFVKSKIDTQWYVFPWERNEVEIDADADDIPIRLLQYIGEDSERGGLLETPKRFLKAWDHWTKGYNEDPKEILKVFEDGADNYDEMVLVKNIPIYSKCEHHLADIFGVAHIAYIPDGRIVGLSKLSRVADLFARRLQVQERLTNQIANALNENLKPLGVGVILECRHMCMESRGICQQGHSTTTSAMLGVFKEQQATREEFLRLIR